LREEHPFLFSFDEEMVKIIPEIQILAHILKHLKNGTYPKKNRNAKMNSEEQQKI